MAENINIDFMPNRRTSDIQRVTTVEDYLKLLTDRTKFCFTSVYDDFADMGKRIEYLENYSLAMPSSVDLTVENAVILQEKESQQAIHNYTKVHYVDGNSVGYGDLQNSIICNGYTIRADKSGVSPDDFPYYEEMAFAKSGTVRVDGSNVSASASDIRVYTETRDVSPTGVRTLLGVFSYTDNETGEERATTLGYVTSTYMTKWGISPYWKTINPPTEDFPYGLVEIGFSTRYYNGSEWKQVPVSNQVRVNIPFASEAEYNAAVGLTNTPLELLKLQDFQYLVPESQIIVDKALSPDSDNVIANSAVAKALAEKADKGTVETLSLVVDSKADIIELEALAEIVNEKAESSDLTAHVDGKDNPHNVTKEQIGLSNVENKSSADILSELQVGGTQILRGTNTTTILGAASGGSTWETGGWRIASSTTSGIYRESIVVTDAPNANIRLGWKLYGGSGNVDIAQDNVPIAFGNTYTLSCYARGNGILRLQYGKNPYVANNFTISNTTTWTKYSMTFVANETEGAVQNGLTNIYIGRMNKNGDSIEICGMKLETGNKATSWSPSPYDAENNLSSHIADTNNPHSVTKEQIGLSDVDNTSDMDKPVSMAVQAELEMLSLSIEGKADKTETESILQTLENKADKSDLEALSEDYNTTKNAFDTDIRRLSSAQGNQGIILNEIDDKVNGHIGNVENPHSVTKEQLGLANVEDKSSSDILSELQIGGTQILRNTQTTTLGSVSTPALWSEGVWRKASGTNGTWESVDVTDCPEPYIEKGWRITSNSATITISQNNIPLVVGEEYILSVYAKGKGSLLLNTVAAAGGGSTTSRFDIDSEKWTKYSHIFTAQAFAEQSVYIGVQYQGDSIEVCGMKLEIGNKATAWNICPKDISNHEERIAALEATILSLGGET